MKSMLVCLFHRCQTTVLHSKLYSLVPVDTAVFSSFSWPMQLWGHTSYVCRILYFLYPVYLLYYVTPSSPAWMLSSSSPNIITILSPTLMINGEPNCWLTLWTYYSIQSLRSDLNNISFAILHSSLIICTCSILLSLSVLRSLTIFSMSLSIVRSIFTNCSSSIG